jgi:hypothetical protein
MWAGVHARGRDAWLVFTLLFKPIIGVVFGLIIGTVDWLVSWLLAQLLVVGFIGQLISGLVIGAVVGLLFGALQTAWPAFAMKRCWLASRGCLPWRLIMFLTDAHQRGVLRQNGTAYQFRHVQLQKHFAGSSSAAETPIANEFSKHTLTHTTHLLCWMVGAGRRRHWCTARSTGVLCGRCCVGQ